MQDSIDLTRRWVDVLAAEIGIRFAGTENDGRAADFVEAEFRQLFPEVIRHEFRFLGWRPLGEGVLEIEGESFPTCLGTGCPSTPEEGFSGKLCPFGASRTYGLWEEGGRGPSAHIMAYTGPGGKAIPLLWTPHASIAAGVVGAEMQELLARAAQDEYRVRFTCRTEYIPGARSWNIEGIIPGDPDRWVVVVAHFDTQHTTPGANDNTASLACLPAMAQRLLAQPRSGRPTLRFLASGGEEVGLRGSRSYVRDQRWIGDDQKIALALNFDSLTWGDTLQIRHSDNTESLLSIFDEVRESIRFSAYSGECTRAPLELDGQVDSIPFLHAGIPTINVNTEGDATTSALWHTPEDRADRVPWPRVDDAIALFHEFIDRI